MVEPTFGAPLKPFALSRRASGPIDRRETEFTQAEEAFSYFLAARFSFLGNLHSKEAFV